MCAFFLPDDVRWILEKLYNSGYRADIVGGPVRDMLRGVMPNDFDITTSARPEETKNVFIGERIIETGIKHGTVTLLKNGEQYEITTYRVDGEYEDSRHPKSVSFTTCIEEDLARRDFTVNAIAYSEKFGLTDPFDGREDIKNRIIRAVGIAEDRFTEDALRIVRGIRFASTLGFKIEEETKCAMIKTAHLLANISRERIFVEWKKLLEGSLALDIIREFGSVVFEFLPEVSIPQNIDKSAFEAASPLARHISLFTEVGAEKYRIAMQGLKTDRTTIDAGVAVISSIGKYEKDDSGFAFMLRDLGLENAKLLLECEAILGLSDIAEMELLLKVESSGVPYKLSMLNINGNDLLTLGLSGTLVGKALYTIQEKVLSGEVQNDKNQLMSVAKDIKEILT